MMHGQKNIKFTTFMCRLSWNLGASTSWNPQGLSRPVMGLLYVYLLYRNCSLLTGGVFVPDIWNPVWCWCLNGVHAIACHPGSLLQKIFGGSEWLRNGRKLRFHDCHAVHPGFPAQYIQIGGHHVVYVGTDSCHHVLCPVVQTIARNRCHSIRSVTSVV